MDSYRSDQGISAAILHFVLGAVFGSVIFGFVTWFFFAPALVISLALAGAVVMGTCAAIWRSRFWAALARNPLFQAWRFLNGSR